MAEEVDLVDAAEGAVGAVFRHGIGGRSTAVFGFVDWDDEGAFQISPASHYTSAYGLCCEAPHWRVEAEILRVGDRINLNVTATNHV